MRIEVKEKYPIDDSIDTEYAETLRNLKLDPPSREWGFRRTMILVEQIERPAEIPGNKKECQLLFWSGCSMIIGENYDDFCVKLHDIEEQMLIEQELIQYEIDQAANQSE